MKVKTNILSFLLIGLSILITSTFAGEMRKTFDFSEREISFKRENNYDAVLIRRCFPSAEIGKPQLPIKPVNFLIPSDAKVENITVSSQSIELSGEYNIIPAQIPKIIGADWQWTEPNPEIYNSATPYPERVAELVNEGYFSGRKIASILIYPLQYIPREKKLILNTEIIVTLQYSSATNTGVYPLRMLPETEKTFKKMIESMVVNSNDAERFSPRAEIVEPSIPQKFAPTKGPSQTGSPISYVIITNDELANTFQTFADWKTKKGVPAVVRTLSWIRSRYDGQDDQERIRNFIKDAFINWGTVWVLIGGDVNIIPYREASMRFYYHDLLRVSTDLYYACLDGNWNADGDDKFGEIDDSTDLYPEVFVGRASVENTFEANVFVTKVINYEKTSATQLPDYYTKMLFIGEDLFERGDSKGLCDTIADYHIPVYFQKARLYEDGNWSNNLRHSQVMDSLNQGFALIYTQNHGGPEFLRLGASQSRRLTKNDISSLTNGNRQSIWYCITCGANKFQYDCFSERFLNNPNGGGVAFIGSTTWDAPWSFFSIDTLFFDYLFSDFYRIGEALHLSKAYFIPVPYIQMAQFGKMLLGDPEMPVWTNTPQPMSVKHLPEIPLGPNLFKIRVTTPPPSVIPVTQSLVCVMKDNEFYAYGFTDENGEIIFNICPESPGNISVVVTKHNCETYEGTCQAVPKEPYVSFADKKIIDRTGNGNEVPEAGEIILLPVWLKNMGFGTAYNVNATLFTNDTFITVTQLQSFFGNIYQEETRLGEPPYEFEIDKDCPDNHQVYFALDITSDQGQYKDTLIITIQAPRLIHFRHIVDDDTIPPSRGNGNGYAEKEETIELPIVLRNEGLGQGDDVTAILGCDDPEVIILNNLVNFGSIPARKEKGNTGNHLLFRLSPNWQGKIPFTLTITDRYEHIWYDTFYLVKMVAPEGLSAAPGRDYIDLVWSPLQGTNLLGYNVYRRTDTLNPYSRVNELPITNGTYFKDLGLERAKTYYYAVTAIDSSRNESYYSLELVAKTNPPDQFGWPRKMRAGALASVVACDFDRAYPGLEVIAADYEGTIYMWHYDGTGVISPDGIFADTKKPVYASPAVGDIDRDGQLEIVTLHTDFDSVCSYLRVWDYPATCIWEKKIPAWSVATPVLGEVRGNGDYLEIIVATRDNGRSNDSGMIYLYDHQGNGGLFIQGEDLFHTSSPALGDIDCDGQNEIIIGGANGVYAWRSDGTRYEPLYGWPGNTPNANFGSVVIGDINPDKPGREIAVASTYYSKLYVGGSDGSILEGWPRWIGYYLNDHFASPALFYDQSDGLVIVIGGCDGIYAYNRNGELLPGFPAFRKRYSNSNPTIGDITGDGNVEIVIGSGLEDDRLYAFDLQGEPILGFPVPAEYPIPSTPTLTDIDFDGDIEIIVASDDKKVYVFDLPSEYQPYGYPWPMFRHDLHRTGCYDALKDDLLISQTEDKRIATPLRTFLSPIHPNPFTTTAEIAFGVGKEGNVSLSIFDCSGRLVRNLINKRLKPGNYCLRWDGKDDKGRGLAQGIYFYRFQTDDFKATKKMVLLK